MVRMPEITWKLDVGHILTVAALIIGMAVGWGSVTQKLDEHSRTLVNMQTEFRSELNSIHSKVDAMREQQVKTDTELKIREAERDDDEVPLRSRTVYPKHNGQ